MIYARSTTFSIKSILGKRKFPVFPLIYLRILKFPLFSLILDKIPNSPNFSLHGIFYTYIPGIHFLNTISKRLYLIIKTRLLSSIMHAQLTDSPATTRGHHHKAAISHADNTRSLGDPGPLSTSRFVYNMQSPTQ